MTVALSLLTVYWHHQMFELYEIEIQVKGKNQSLMAIILTMTIKKPRINPSPFLTESLLDTQAPAAFPIAKISPILSLKT